MPKSSIPSFLLKNRFGTFYFQRRIPKSFRSNNPSIPVFVRLSLKTKSVAVAKKLARLLAAMWDQRAKQYFRSEEDFHRGMKLLEEYLLICSRNASFEEISAKFFDKIDDITDVESDLLDRASRYYSSKKLDTGINPYEDHLAKISNLIEQKFSTDTQHQPINKGELLSKSYEDYLLIHRNRWKKNSNMENSSRDAFNLLLSITGDIQTSDLSKAHINNFIKILLNYPANKNKKSKYLSIKPLEFLNIEVPDKDKLSPISVKKYKTQVGSFLKWLKFSDLTNVDLYAPLQSINITAQRSSKQRDVFHCDDLRKLFNSNDYQMGLHKTASRFWVPLIALYTGARLNEICQMSTNDIYQHKSDNNWVFDFNENNDVPNKSLKEPHHARCVPIHKRLIDLGLLDYIEKVKKNSTRIFPELKYAGVSNKYGNDIQRWFNRTYKNSNNCNITTPKTSFHSIRHTVITHFSVDHGITENQVSGGLGQIPEGGVFESRYSKQDKYSAYKKYFSLINFDKCFDYKLIKPWKYHQFCR